VSRFKWIPSGRMKSFAIWYTSTIHDASPRVSEERRMCLRRMSKRIIPA
jgi:hypothetical protein